MQYFILIHRWIGVGLCLFFSAWFLSGMVMIFQPYPSLSEAERLKRSEVTQYSKDLLSISELKSFQQESPSKVTLISKLDEPYFWWKSEANSRITVVNAITGDTPNFKPDQIHKIANNFYPDKTVETINVGIEYDQWIVSNRFDPYRPFYRVEFDDVARTNIYISSRNGQILQETNRSQRIWNYFGAVVHWIYPTVIRKNWILWDQLVWWLALAGIVSAITGLTLGLIKSIRAQSGWSDYSGWLYWHHLGGLIVGLLVLSWIFSGWLSMDHGRIFSKPNPTTEQIQAFHGVPLSGVVNSLPEFEPAYSSNINEIELRVIAGEPYLLSKSYTEGNQTWLLNSEGHWQQQDQGLPYQLLRKAVMSTWPDLEIAGFFKIENDDVYAHLRESQMSSNVLRVVLSDPEKTWVHVDSISGEIISIMDSGRRTYRWLFNGLHSLDFPSLISRPALWYCVILSLLGLGTLFSFTGAIVGIRRLLKGRF